MRNRHFPARMLVALAALGVVAVLTLGPRALVSPARGRFMTWVDSVTAPLSVWIPYDDLEKIANVGLFVPLGIALALILHARAWPVAILLGAAVSLGAEWLQRSIPGRVPDGDDVVWNTLGAAIGVLVVVLVRTAWRRRRVASAR